MAQARLQVEQGQLAEAEATMARHGQYAERNADYQAFHALLLQKLQRPKDAAERFRAAVALRPGEGRWWYGLGSALETDQRPGEAREAFQKARDAGNLSAELAALVEQRLR
jgi:MSHA biogenesis protein MshN